jgi:dTDP-4-amino-4,6-dideoxygalactose transaminase
MDSPKSFLPYGRQHITPEDIEAVAAVLTSDWLTQGPTIAAFEARLAERVDARFAVACANRTAALAHRHDGAERLSVRAMPSSLLPTRSWLTPDCRPLRRD